VRQPPRQHEIAVDEAAVTEVARRYYLYDQSKVTIAAEMGLSRFQVARMLQTARNLGIVRIEVGRAGRVDESISEELAGHLGIRRAVVLTGLDGLPDDEITDQIGRALSDVLTATVTAGETLGLSYSRQIAAMAGHVRQLPRCDVVQLAGHLLRATDAAGSPEIVRQVAAASGGTSHPIYCPMLVADASVATALRRQEEIADALERGRAVDRAVVSIGAWAPGLSGIYQAVTAREQELGTALGVCGEISGRLFDGDGRPVRDLLDERIIALSLAEFRALPCVIGSCYGAERADAARTAARSGLVDVLVTEAGLARRLLTS